MPALNYTDKQLRDSQQDLLVKRILACFATNSTFKQLVKDIQEFKYVQGEPPKGKNLSSPGVFVRVLNDNPSIWADGSVQFPEYLISIKIILKNERSYHILPVNADGTWAEVLDKEHTALRESSALEEVMRSILEVDGYDCRWYFDFVQKGIMGARGGMSFNYESFGGSTPGGNSLMFQLACVIKVQTWSCSTNKIADGNISITVTDTTPASGATVWITDKCGNPIEDSSGVYKWLTNGSGVASASDLVAQSHVTIHATKGTKSGTATLQTIPNSGTLTASIALS
jgi:hypothetical protein